MTKAVVRFGYKEYVMEPAQALQFAEMLNSMERYESKYQEEPDTRKSKYTYHVYEEEAESITEIKLITDHHYRVAKAAGKPEK
jgi:hypothetical protein